MKKIFIIFFCLSISSNLLGVLSGIFDPVTSFVTSLFIPFNQGNNQENNTLEEKKVIEKIVIEEISKKISSCSISSDNVLENELEGNEEVNVTLEYVKENSFNDKISEGEISISQNLEEKQEEELAEELCPICRETLHNRQIIVKLVCSSKHEFHHHCINPWLKIAETCPICRGDVLDYGTSRKCIPRTSETQILLTSVEFIEIIKNKFFCGDKKSGIQLLIGTQAILEEKIKKIKAPIFCIEDNEDILFLKNVILHETTSFDFESLKDIKKIFFINSICNLGKNSIKIGQEKEVCFINCILKSNDLTNKNFIMIESNPDTITLKSEDKSYVIDIKKKTCQLFPKKKKKTCLVM